MWKKARNFLPSLADAKTIPEYPFAQGLRPFSHKNAKVRADGMSFGLNFVHNYGHGGSDWTLTVGCARATVNLLEKTMGGVSGDSAKAAVYGKV